MPSPSPVHSAHVGQELEIHYRWHPYFRRKVLVRRVEQRATGQFVQVEGSTGIIICIAGWMLDPVACARMAMGAPRVNLVALLDLKQALIGADTPGESPNDDGFVREKGDEVSRFADAIASRQMSLLFDSNRIEGLQALERGKVALALAQVLIQAAGVRVEELDDDRL